MSLPGKLCIGILEEDNPLKSYFRFKPLLVDEGGSYVPYTEGQIYPQDGCIRIVPDKNESYHFKARMRRIGLFCVVDLRGHPEENDKIRPNKNYREEGPEQNAYIIYSDVVRGPAPEMIYEILPKGEPEALRPAPHTAEVLLRGEALDARCWRWQDVEDAEGWARLVEGERECGLEDLQVFDLPGFRDETLSFAVVPAGKMEKVTDVQEPQKPAAEPQPAAKAPAPKPEPATEAPAPKPEPAAKPEPGRAPENGVENAEKPWIHHDSSVAPAPPDPRLSPAQRLMAAQAGLNPRRGRSLQELIDEKWQQSRMNQLGQPVAPITTGAPVVSPVENAVRSVREVWSQPNLRQDLLESLGGIEEFGASLEECREAARQRDIEGHLENLEAQRLALLGELDHLKAGGEALRAQLKQEIRREATGELAEAVRQVDAAKAEREKYEKLASEAKAAAQDARKAVEALTGEELERRLRDLALNDRMLERMAEIKGEAQPLPEPMAPENTGAEALLGRVVARFEAEGYAISRFEALNLCACLAVSPVMILSGPVGCGKSETARLLGEALGWKDAGRWAAFGPGRKPLEGDARVAALARQPEDPAMLLLDDANLYPACDPLRGLGAALAHPAWRLCLTAQDSHSGHPLPANLLDKGFTVRLTPKPDAPWQPKPKAAFAPQPPVSLAALEEWRPRSESAVPAACGERMDALRKGLSACGAAISRRALDDAWNYCGMMAAGMGEAADAAAITDLAVAQRLLPALLASAPIEALRKLPALLAGMPVSLALLNQPLPVMI